VHIHLHETVREVEESIERHGVRPLERLDRLGLLSERLIAVHAIHLTDQEIAQLGRVGASVVHCPVSNLKLANGLARVPAMLAAGVNVGAGHRRRGEQQPPRHARRGALCRLARQERRRDAAMLPAAAALQCATINGARALGLEARIGSIEVGKEADRVAVELASPEVCPLFDPVSHLIYASGREHVTDVWVAGRRVVQTRQLVADEGIALIAAVLSSSSAGRIVAGSC